MKRETKKTLIIVLCIVAVIALVCFGTYKSQPKKEVVKVVLMPSDEQKEQVKLVKTYGADYEMKPRDMHLHHLQHETKLMGFGMGPGLVDSRRHHIIA